MATDDQVAPFHISAVGAPLSLAFPLPTAMQNTDVTQETPVSVLPVLAEAGFGMADQFEALTCAGTVRPWGAVAPPPVASRSVIGNANNASAHPAVRKRIANRISTSRIASGWRSGRTLRHLSNVEEGSCIGIALP